MTKHEWMKPSSTTAHEVLTLLRCSCKGPDEASVTLIYTMILLRDTQFPEMSDSKLIEVISTAINSHHEEGKLQ